VSTGQELKWVTLDRKEDYFKEDKNVSSYITKKLC